MLIYIWGHPVQSDRIKYWPFRMDDRYFTIPKTRRD